MASVHAQCCAAPVHLKLIRVVVGCVGCVRGPNVTYRMPGPSDRSLGVCKGLMHTLVHIHTHTHTHTHTCTDLMMLATTTGC